MKSASSSSLDIYCDGGSRGNPGPAGIGFVIKDNDNNVIHEGSEYIEDATNNIAEYQGVIHALRWVKQNKKTISAKSIKFYLDSKLVVNQLQGNFKVKDNKLRDLFATAQHLIQEINLPVEYQYIPREQNSHADALVNKALHKQFA